MLIFTHVPKTAGSTINGAAVDLFGSDAVITKNAAEIGALDESVCFIGGHIQFNEINGRYPAADFVVSIRNPLHRILSHYFMLLRNNSEAARDLGSDLPGKAFRGFYKHWISRKRFGDLQCQYLCGSPSAELAIAAIKENYALAWESEMTALAWPQIYSLVTGDAPNQSPELRRRMVGTNVPGRYEGFLDAESLRMLLDDNKQDMLLYEWIISERGLWQRPSSTPAATLKSAI